MTERSINLRSDEELLALAQIVLVDNGFVVESIDERLHMLLAENHYFVIAIIAPSTIRTLMQAESIAFQILEQRISRSEIGPKKWDAYLVLLTQERSNEDDETTRGLYAINHDMSHLRRMAHTDVEPTAAAVARALSTFLEPIHLEDEPDRVDALETLADSLSSRGVEDDLVQRAVRVFSQGGALDDIL